METSLYEKSRELRIKQNLERMQKLGIVDLSLKLKSSVSPNPNHRNSFHRKKTSPFPHDIPPPSGPVPIRRSSRLQNATPVSYSEVEMEKKNKFSETEGIMLDEGVKPEIYSEEHEKLLGNTEKSWTLFVDGYGKDGKRIYDPLKGKTCHQCRQKTLGLRTHCCKCNLVQGQFCGDCLYMRYGEHVLEAQQNPNWVCPVCRGICNCSLCRHAKGWLATGPLYKKIARMGFKSVAHFLIQTRRAQPSSEQDPPNLVSAKRSLSFTGSAEINDNFLETLEHQFENNAGEKFNEIDGHISAKRSLDFPCLEKNSREIEPMNLKDENDELRLSDLKFADYDCMKIKNDGNHIPLETYSTPDKKLKLPVESNTNSIVGGLSQGGGTEIDHSNKELSEVQGTSLLTDQSYKKKTELSQGGTGIDYGNKELSEAQGTALLTDQSLKKKTEISSQITSETPTGQQSLECDYVSDLIDRLPGAAEKTLSAQHLSEHPVSGSKRDKKLQISGEQILDCKSGADPDSIYGRLRKRQRICNDHDGNETPTIYGRSVDVKQQNKEPIIVSECSRDNIIGKTRQKKGSKESKDDGVSQETISDEGVNSLSGKMETAPVKLSTSPEPTSESIGRRLRPRRKTTTQC